MLKIWRELGPRGQARVAELAFELVIRLVAAFVPMASVIWILVD